MLLASTNGETRNQRYVAISHSLFLKDVKHITFERHHLRYLHFYLLLEQLGVGYTSSVLLVGLAARVGQHWPALAGCGRQMISASGRPRQRL